LKIYAEIDVCANNERSVRMMHILVNAYFK